ncbi:efflux RND transporter periplasmic adaptor subunit [Celeribacter sp.]|uniref:efflux RND transporter periplasmic adaptor subunit n=1 Tax=Celeribacter sp. TaxID=1890673 RepID=UPI003A933647
MVKDKIRHDQPQTVSSDGANSLVVVPDQKHSRRTKPATIIGGAIAVVAIAVAGWVFSGGGGTPVVAVETLASGPVQRVLAVSGRSATDEYADVVASVSARVLSVNAQEGARVEAGEALIVLDDTQQKAIVRQAEAALETARLALQSARGERDRAVALGTSISSVAVENAERAFNAARLDVERLEAARDQAQLALADYQIPAPITGIVLNSYVDRGDLVSPSQVLMRIADIENLHVDVQIDEIYAGEVRVGQSAQMQLAGRSDIVNGVVSYVASEVDEVTGSLRVKLSFDAPIDAQIGLTTVANILIEAVDNAVTVPRSAFVENNSGTAVFTLRDGKAVLTPITFIDWPAERVEVVTGLSVGDIVVLSPDGLTDGDAIAREDTSGVGK